MILSVVRTCMIDVHATVHTYLCIVKRRDRVQRGAPCVMKHLSDSHLTSAGRGERRATDDRRQTTREKRKANSDKPRNKSQKRRGRKLRGGPDRTKKPSEIRKTKDIRSSSSKTTGQAGAPDRHTRQRYHTDRSDRQIRHKLCFTGTASPNANMFFLHQFRRCYDYLPLQGT